MLLGIETAADLAGVALADGSGVIASAEVRGTRRHAEVLAPAVSHVLEQVGVPLGTVEAVAVDVGPGLFTGLRVGIATAQGIARGLGVGVVAVTSLAVLARAAYDAGWEGPLAAVVDARRGEVFSARFAGPTAQTAPPQRFAPGALAAELSAVPGTVLVGGGAQRYRSVFAGLRVAALTHPTPAALVALAADRLAAGVRPEPPAAVRPVYLREADARINWVQR